MRGGGGGSSYYEVNITWQFPKIGDPNISILNMGGIQKGTPNFGKPLAPFTGNMLVLFPRP